MGRGIDQHGITIWRRAGDFAHANNARSAGAVFHHNLPAFLLSDFARHQTAQNVTRPARREGDHEADGRSWPSALRLDDGGRDKPSGKHPSTR